MRPARAAAIANLSRTSSALIHSVCQSASSHLKGQMFALCASQIVDFLVRFADFARTCAVIVNVPDLKAYSSVAAKLLRRVTSYASSEALLYRSCELRGRTHPPALRQGAFFPCKNSLFAFFLSSFGSLVFFLGVQSLTF